MLEEKFKVICINYLVCILILNAFNEVYLIIFQKHIYIHFHCYSVYIKGLEYKSRPGPPKSQYRPADAKKKNWRGCSQRLDGPPRREGGSRSKSRGPAPGFYVGYGPNFPDG